MSGHEAYVDGYRCHGARPRIYGKLLSAVPKGDRGVFRESPKYLDFICALDASTPCHDQVVIPNYVTSHGNCLQISAFHRLCCVNECELLMTQLEAIVRKPDVRPADLLEAVAILPSDTVLAPRNLSESLQNRLFEIPRVNDGSVPLRGRTFSEWMHRAFRNECPMPGHKRSQKIELKKEDRLATRQETEAIIQCSV